jgi:hypothetical protein
VITIATAQYQALGPPLVPTVYFLSDGKKYPHITTSLLCVLQMNRTKTRRRTIASKETDFVDLTARPSAIHVEVPPKTMLKTKSALFKTNGKRFYYNPLQKTMPGPLHPVPCYCACPTSPCHNRIHIHTNTDATIIALTIRRHSPRTHGR